MNKHRHKQFFILFLLIMFSVGGGICIARSWYGLSLLSFIATGITAFRLMSFQNRTIRDLRRFASAVKFGEFNISFRNSVEKGLDKEIGAKLEDALEMLSEKTQQKEGWLNFYDLLLNRIDFAIIAVDADDRVTWINKAAVNMVGRLKELSGLSDFSSEIYDSVRQLTPGEIKTVKLSDEYGNKDIAVSMANVYIRGDDLRIISLKNIRPIIEQTESEAWRKLVGILRHEIMNSMAPIISLAETFSASDAELNSDIIHKTMQTIY
ncbi:MAG: hypothetical protein LBG28_00230, partial [Tannerella sp.]|nr:hypothetical protein [Tannerella sp.]